MCSSVDEKNILCGDLKRSVCNGLSLEKNMYCLLSRNNIQWMRLNVFDIIRNRDKYFFFHCSYWCWSWVHLSLDIFLIKIVDIIKVRQIRTVWDILIDMSSIAFLKENRSAVNERKIWYFLNLYRILLVRYNYMVSSNIFSFIYQISSLNFVFYLCPILSRSYFSTYLSW